MIMMLRYIHTSIVCLFLCHFMAASVQATTRVNTLYLQSLESVSVSASASEAASEAADSNLIFSLRRRLNEQQQQQQPLQQPENSESINVPPSGAENINVQQQEGGGSIEVKEEDNAQNSLPQQQTENQPQTPVAGGDGQLAQQNPTTGAENNSQELQAQTQDQVHPQENQNDNNEHSCLEAKTCNDCKGVAATVVQTTNGYTCFWKKNDDDQTYSCQLTQADATKTDTDMCAEPVAATVGFTTNGGNPEPNTDTAESTEETSSAAPPVQNEISNGSEFEQQSTGNVRSGSSPVMGILLVLLVGGVAYYGRSRFMGKQQGGSPSGDHDDASSTFTSFSSIIGSAVGGKSKFKKSETEPLASGGADDDEEWGWEDSSSAAVGDVEMTSSSKQDEDLTMAFAMTKSATKASPVTSRNTRVPAFAATTAASTPAIPAMAISSLGKTSLVTKKKKPPPKKKNDDLFASMGLSAKPTFSHKPKTSRPKGSSTLAATDLAADTAQWDDDGDLDDLLED